MKRLINELVFGRNALVSGIFALSVVGLIALGCSCNKDFSFGNSSTSNTSDKANVASTSDHSSSSEAPPDNATVEQLVKETTAQFAEAVDTENFSDIHANASSDFQSTYTVQEMAEAFKSYTEKKSVVVPILDKVGGTDAEFTKAPAIRTEKGLRILVASGKFPTKPYNVRFDYEYVYRAGQWKLLKLVINIP